ncbi:MAG: D-alanyl-D-alanine carboxypeptidase [Alphaproteobacteria bacterium]|nr:D-alanyl-D-alanine carboxypeptidase [Alphaproteobacteria bacterium]
MRYFILFLLVSISAFAQVDLKSKYAVLMDAHTGEVLYEKEAHVPVPPSSMSKLMTGYLLLEAIQAGKLMDETMLTVSETGAYKANSGESAMYLKQGDKVSVADLFKGIMIMSGGDACRVVAEGVSGSVDKFVAAMNAKARAMGLEQSEFINPTGMAEDGQLMSVRDIAVLSRRFMMDFPAYYHVLKQKFFDYKGYTEEQRNEYEFAMWNRNRLLWFYRGADGLKTGHTDKGGYGLAASAKKGDRRLIAVINGLKLSLGRTAANRERGREAARLLDYGFEKFDQKTFFKKGTEILKIPVWFGKEYRVRVGSNVPVFVTVKKETDPKINVKASFVSPLKAPIEKGQEVGKLTVYKDGKAVIHYPLVALDTVKKIPFGMRLFRNIKYLIRKFL